MAVVVGAHHRQCDVFVLRARKQLTAELRKRRKTQRPEYAVGAHVLDTLVVVVGPVHQNSTPLDLSDESVAAGAQAVFDYAHATVRDEDYRLVEGLQANLESGARDHLLFGRNEPGLQHRHISWDQALAASAVVS
jgi:hypothetical protein